MNQYTKTYLSKLAEELTDSKIPVPAPSLPIDQDIINPATTPQEQRENSRINELTRLAEQKNKADAEAIKQVGVNLSQPDPVKNYPAPGAITRSGLIGKYIPQAIHNAIGTPAAKQWPPVQEIVLPEKQLSSLSPENKELLKQELKRSAEYRNSVISKSPEGTYAKPVIRGDISKLISEQANVPKLRASNQPSMRPVVYNP